ncbi:16S rRNA (guanine(527)-N(7))-methyltransferase RsmG [Pseudorhodoferax sp. LjRoot39]|uniref:16S rRNA (guanine(527)-N(7))-methyltransferase RsmG n=1 Tax=Pseudorhodoferax sp. LjRoot39 TaxID=3342328 RepID=UPI003ECD6543
MKGRLPDAAQALGLALSDAEADALLAYQGLIAKWNKVYNLTAVRDPEQMLTQHLVDCLAAVPPLRRVLAEQGAEAPALLDVGAGAGLPGVVFAILHPQLQVHCVDTVAKKAAFVQQVAVELKLPNLRGLHARVESLGQGYDIVSSRAFASLVDFTTWSRAALKPGAVWLAMKGKEPVEEIAALPPEVQVFHVEHLQVPGLGAERCIVWMRATAA